MSEMITVTDSAFEHIKKTIAHRGSGKGFRLSVKQTGCSGYMYVPEIIDTPYPNDIKISSREDVAIYLDPACEAIVVGTQIDYVKKGLGIAQLEFNNPNVDSQCGCGESFNLKKNESATEK